LNIFGIYASESVNFVCLNCHGLNLSSSSSPVKMSEVSSSGVDYSQREGDSLIDHEEHTSSSLRLSGICLCAFLLFII